MIQPPYPELDDVLTMIGEAGRLLDDIEASEGAAGNISVCLRWQIEVRTRFPVVDEINLPQSVPELAGVTFIVSGSGRRLREIKDEPTASLACIVVNEDGRTGKLHTSYNRRFEQVTSEFNSHLAVHYDQINTTKTNFHAVIHAQPIRLTYLSHIPRYQDEQYLNSHLLRWQPETIINLPEGIGFLPFRLPGSPELMAGNVESLRKHRIVVWAKHGVMARSDVSVKRAADRVEYAETAAKYETLNLSAGEIGEGLSKDEIREICRKFNVQQNIF
jgi:rhamnulose-1-phosphate aldolase